MLTHRGLYENGGKGARTPDLLDAIETLSQLSYAPDSCIINVSESAPPVKDYALIRQKWAWPYFLATYSIPMTIGTAALKRGGTPRLPSSFVLLHAEDSDRLMQSV